MPIRQETILYSHADLFSSTVQKERQITPREREVLKLMGLGVPRGNIATALGISIHTVKNHIRHAQQTLGVSTSTQAVIKAVYRGQIDFQDLLDDSELLGVKSLSFAERRLMDVLTQSIGEPATGKMLGKILYIKLDTVKNHNTSINHKLNARNRTHASVKYLEAKRRGIIPSNTGNQNR